MDGCKWEFNGPAMNTIQFLSAMYKGGSAEVIESTFRAIRGQAAPVTPTAANWNQSSSAAASGDARMSAARIILRGTVLPKYHSRWQQVALAVSSDSANMTAGSDREAVMRAYIIIAAFAALAMIAIAHTVSTEDRVIGDPDCTVDCSGQAADTENGTGSSLPVAPNKDDDGNNNWGATGARRELFAARQN
jgi:hypothetical protein